jgi:RNA polymerase sigma-70 factor (ECF subfamily)
MSRFRPRAPRAAAAPALDVERLYARHADALLVFLARRTADPQIALDLWAETFAQAFAKRNTLRGTGDDAIAGWLYAIARSQLAGFYRRGVTEQRALGRLQLERPPATAEVLAEIERKAELHETRRELGDALAKLSPAVRDAVKLRVVDELDYRAVADRLGISEATARVRVSRGLSSLAALLDRSTAAARTA